ncbi:MAG: tRNA pseudouridine(55) synthase TruB [Candidatus Gastranaerophilales bacterium]|nr:tRNA pseudouridine(55) synthase TruB [Candidatus Gastranaerophilales bacterium]
MYFLNINKPKGITSFDVVRVLRKKLGIKQIGHSGTLDPLASGVMQVAVGNATKLLDYLDSDKEYIASIKFGYVSTTFDEEGEKTFVSKPDFNVDKLIETMNSFLGKTKQIPPKYSAIKVNGKKLCDIARKNPDNDIEIASREIEIYSIELIEFHNDFAKIKVFCKKGTYIRSLVNDIGQKLGCGAYMTDLIRTKAGNFMIEKADLLDSDNYSNLNPLDVLNLSKYELSNEEYGKIMNGNFIGNKGGFINSPILLTKDYKLVSVAILSDNLIKPKKTFKGE